MVVVKGWGCHSWLRLWSQLLLWRLITAGTSERLKRSGLLFGAMRWDELNAPSICHSSLWSEWDGVIQDGVHHVRHPPLCHCFQTVQFQPHHRAGLHCWLTESAGIVTVDAASPPHYSQEQCPGHCRLSAACSTH